MFPDLAAFNDKGAPETVKYHLLPALLLSARQHDHRMIQEQKQLIAAKAERIAALERRLARLEAMSARAAP